MKKIISMLLALAMVLSLAACGAQQAPATEAPATQAPATRLVGTHNPDHALLLQDQVAILDRNGVLTTGLSTDVLNEKDLAELYGTELKLFYEECLGREVCAAPQFIV